MRREELAHTAPPRSADDGRTSFVAVGSILAALAAASCCVLPLALFSVGISGAWIGALTAMAPYQPVFVVLTVGILVYGYYLVYWKPKTGCGEVAACARPLPYRIVKVSLWTATVLVLAAATFPFFAPYLLQFA